MSKLWVPHQHENRRDVLEQDVRDGAGYVACTSGVDNQAPSHFPDGGVVGKWVPVPTALPLIKSKQEVTQNDLAVTNVQVLRCCYFQERDKIPANTTSGPGIMKTR